MAMVAQKLLLFCLGTPLLSNKRSILSRTMKEDEDARSYKLTMVCGIYHSLTVILVGTEFFCSFLTSRAWKLKGIYGRSIYTQMRVKCRVKWS